MNNAITTIDTHAHICDASFDADRGAVLQAAADKGVVAVVAVGEDLLDAERNVSLSKMYPQVRAAAGLYPTHLDLDQAVAVREFIRNQREQLWAIGEVGLDFWKVKGEAGRERQRDIFAAFIDLSLILDLPLNVHSRSAGRHAIDMLLQRGAKKVQLHAFDAKASTAKAAVDAGYFFSIPPSVVRSRQKQKLVKQLPISCLLLESDSPVLGPDPQKRNEPVNTLAAANAIAAIKAMSVEAVLDATLENTCRLYGEIL